MTESGEIVLKGPEPGEKAAPPWVDEVIVEPGKKCVRVELWTPSERYPQYSHTLRPVEKRKVNGERKRTSIILSNHPPTMFVIEAIEQAWAKLREPVGRAEL